MALQVLSSQNVRNDIAAGNIDLDYADPLRDVINEIYNRMGYGGIIINNEDNEPCGECNMQIYYNSPRPNNYSDWIWIDLETVDCNFWIHLVSLNNKERLWSWSVWNDRRMPQLDQREYYSMPPDFNIRTVYKTLNIQGDLSILFDQICHDLPRLCDCNP